MEPTGPTSDADLLEAAVELLTQRLPATWTVEKTPAGDENEPQDLALKSPNGTPARLLVETRPEISARDVQVLLGGPWKRWRRQTGNPPILVIARYIGPRVRELLTEEDVSYVDLTGNARIRIDYPGLFIQTEGATRDPRAEKPRAGIRGAKAGAIVRVLVDAAPPYSGADIAEAADVNEGYASRILGTLQDEGLIDRERFGPITRVDWPTLLRRRAQALDLFGTPGTARYVARQGTRDVIESLTRRPANAAPTITGSFAASRLAPITAPTLLVIYTMTPRELANELELLPAETGADTVLIRPDNPVVFARSTRDNGLTWAAPSQVAIDCLAGSGRMPSEGEALIEWMRDHEILWRAPSIAAFLEAPRPKKA